MSEYQDELTHECLGLRERKNMRASLEYLRLLCNDVEEFEALSISTASHERKAGAFKRLMTLTLGSTTTWARLHNLSNALGIGTPTLQRYVTRKSAPHPFMFPAITAALKQILKEEFEKVELVLYPLEEAAQAKQAAELQKWREFEKRVCNPLPGTTLNCQARYSPSASVASDFPLQLLFAYPCRGIYNLSEYFPLVCEICEKNGKEQAHTHGRVLLSSEDGMMLLPHIVHTQAELLQVVEDLLESDQKKRMFVLEDNPTWYDECKRSLASSEVVQTLPLGDARNVQKRDLATEKLGGWWFC